MKAIRTIGFTGTIASGKTSRCKRLIEIAHKRALEGKGGQDRLPLGVPQRGPPAAPTSATTSSSKGTSESDVIAHSPSVIVQYLNADLIGHRIYEPGKPCYYEVLQHFGKSILSVPTAPPATTKKSNVEEAAGTVWNDPESPTKTRVEPLIDRQALGQIVFSEERKLQELNAICWPYISAAIKEEYAKICAGVAAASATITPTSVSPSHLLSHLDAHVPSPSPTPSCSTSTTNITPATVALIIVEAALLCEMLDVLALTTDVWITHCTPDIAVDRVMVRNRLSREAAEQRVACQMDVDQKLLHLRELPYKGDIEVFDTTRVSLADGLKELDTAFERYWRAKIATYL